MITEETILDVADNTGARLAKCFRILGQKKRYAYIGDLIKVAIREAQPGGLVKKGEVTEQELIDFGKKQLTGYKRPRHIQFVDELPKSNVGKILRKELRKMEGLE